MGRERPRPRIAKAAPRSASGFNRKTGLNVLFDEVHVPRAQWARAPRQISVALTNTCDLACPFCYAPKHHAVLEPETVIRWLQRSRELTRVCSRKRDHPIPLAVSMLECSGGSRVPSLRSAATPPLTRPPRSNSLQLRGNGAKWHSVPMSLAVDLTVL